MEASRKSAIQSEINKGESSGGDRYNYVDVTKLTRLGISSYATKKGPNFLRIVTPNFTGFFGLEIWRHSDIGVNNRTYLCLEKMFGEKCPVCELVRELKTKNPNDPKVGELYAGRRYLFYVVDTKNEETQKEGIKWFDCALTIKQNICALSKDKRTGEVLDVSDPVEGRDIEFIRVDGKRTTYEGFNLVATQPIPEGWYKGLPDYKDVLLIPTYADVQRELLGMPVSKEIVKEETVKEEVVDDVIKMERAVVEKPVEEKKTDSSGSLVRGSAVQSSNVRGGSTRESSSDASSVQARLNEIRSRRTSQDTNNGG
jgi:hypothetical protein